MALRAATRSSVPQIAALNAARFYSSSKTQTLKERFAELLPGMIEEIKTLKAYVYPKRL